MPKDFVVTYSSFEKLPLKLTGGTICFWPTNGWPTVSMSIKYAILHKIGIVNWFPSIHDSTISTALGHLIYLIGMGLKINVGELVFKHLL